jgi:hypothetical protein
MHGVGSWRNRAISPFEPDRPILNTPTIGTSLFSAQRRIVARRSLGAVSGHSWSVGDLRFALREAEIGVLRHPSLASKCSLFGLIRFEFVLRYINLDCGSLVCSSQID